MYTSRTKILSGFSALPWISPKKLKNIKKPALYWWLKTSSLLQCCARVVGEIAESKMKDLNAANIEGAMEMVKGSARSMGLEILE